MTKVMSIIGGVVAAACLLLTAAAPAQAQAFRTWVSGVGDDANPCSRTAPCKTFAGAISQTAAGGEISVLDPGGFGSVTITKSISLVARGIEGSVLVSGTNGIVINAAATDNVSIIGLTIEGAITGLAGIRVIEANNVYISNTVIRGFQGGSGIGVDIEPTLNGPHVYLKNVEITDNIIGLYMHAGSTKSDVTIDTCTLSGNSGIAAKFNTSTSIGRAIGSSFASPGVSVTNGAELISAGNNFFAAGAPTSTSPLQ